MKLFIAPWKKRSFRALHSWVFQSPLRQIRDAVEEIAHRLVHARDPMIVAGSGRNPAEVPALVTLCELLGAPVVQCAWHGYQSFPLNHRLFQGKRSVADADVVVVLEADVPWVPGPNGPGPDAFVAAISIDPAKHKIPTYEFTADLRVTSDPLSAIEAITAAVRALISAADAERFEARARQWGETAAARIKKVEQEALSVAAEQPINPRWLSYQIAEVLDDNSLVIDDTTHDRLFPYLKIARPGSYFHNPGSAGGWAPGAALGAKLAAPDRDVIAVTGDGFYMYGSPTAALLAGASLQRAIFDRRLPEPQLHDRDCRRGERLSRRLRSAIGIRRRLPGACHGLRQGSATPPAPTARMSAILRRSALRCGAGSPRREPANRR